MKVYTTDKIRNVALLGHGGSGKTSLVESLAYLAGMISKPGTVAAGNTISDYDKQEQKRGFSIKTSMIPIEWQDVKVNILDTPGYADFIGEVEEAVSVADAAVIVVSGKNGVEVGTRRAWDLCEKYHLPRMIFITEMDVDDASYRQTVQDLQDLYHKKIAPFHLPIRENGEFVGYVNVIQQTAKRWNDKGTVDHVEMPEYSKENLSICRDALLEAVAETSEEFMERYFEGDEFSDDEIRQALRVNILDGSICPVLMGSNLTNRGMYTLMADIVKYFPSPDHRTVTGIKANSNEVFEANYDFAKPKSAYVFKTIADPFVGKYSLIKVNSGVLKTDDAMYNQDKGVEEKIGKIYVLTGSKAEEVKELHAGDIGALSKVSVQTTDTLSTKANPIVYVRPQMTKPYCYMAYRAATKGEEDKVAGALAKICQEDLTVRTESDPANRQSLLYGISEQHLDIVVDTVLDKYKVKVELAKPRIAFRETILGKSDVEYKHKKQTGGHGQYGHVKMKFEPSGDLETQYVFEQTVVGGTVPKNYYPAVEKGIAEGVERGPLAGYPVYGIRANLYDGSYHPVDSSEAAFKTASSMAFKKGILEAKPILMEPIASMRVKVRDAQVGDVMGDLNKRRGRVMGMDPVEGGFQIVNAEIPFAALYGYGTQLRSMTGGEGTYEYEFLRYEPCPSDVQQEEIDRRKAEEEAEA